MLEKPSDEPTRPEKWALFFKCADDEKERGKINEVIRKEEGLEKGMQEGIRQMARSMAAEGIPDELIARAAKLPVEKVRGMIQ